jgi:glutamate:GABA antiporter
VQELRRSLGFTDVVLYFLIACTNLQWVATAAAAGPRSLPIWIAGGITMFLPLSLVVMKLAAKFPEEGGMYVWSKRAFGPFAGFITGWTYWCSNLPYFPALMYFAAGNALFVSSRGAQLSASPAFYVTFSLIGFGAVTLLNVLGLDIGKWLINIGAACRWTVTLILIALGALAWWRFGFATPVTPATLTPTFQIKDLIFWSVIAFAFTGPESIPFMGGEIKDARRTIPRALVVAAPAIVIIYIAGTASVLAAVPGSHVSGLYGVMQAIDRVDARVGWNMVTPVVAMLVTVSCLASVAAWLGSIARIPLVAGIDRYLPAAFGRVHPRWGSPVVAILTQASLSAVLIVAGQMGTSVKDAYDILVSSTVLITMIPFVFLFGSALRLRPTPLVIVAAVVGLGTTISAMVLSAFPTENESNPPLAVAKILGLTALMLGIGAVAYFFGTRRQEKHAVQI